MGLDALPTALLDNVVEVAGYEHGWKLEVASPALRAASAACVERQLGTCWLTEELPGAARSPERRRVRTAVTFQPRWRHCAAAKHCGPLYLKVAGNPSDIEPCVEPGVDVELPERGDDEENHEKRGTSRQNGAREGGLRAVVNVHAQGRHTYTHHAKRTGTGQCVQTHSTHLRELLLQIPLELAVKVDALQPGEHRCHLSDGDVFPQIYLKYFF